MDHDSQLEIGLNYAGHVLDADYPIGPSNATSSIDARGIEALDADLARCRCCSSDELDVLTDRRRATVVPFADRSTVIERVLAQAARIPNAVAMIGPGAGPVTYGQLAERTIRLANLLRQQGVGVDDRVAVRVDRGPDMVVAILGALHAGAAYLPIDPSHPAERIRYLLEDSAAKVVLTDARRPRHGWCGNDYRRIVDGGHPAGRCAGAGGHRCRVRHLHLRIHRAAQRRRRRASFGDQPAGMDAARVPHRRR